MLTHAIDIISKFARAQDNAHDAASAAEDVSYELGKISEELESIIAERDALRAVLREILQEAGPRELAHWDGSRWVISADIPSVFIERAEKLLGEKP